MLQMIESWVEEGQVSEKTPSRQLGE